MGETLMTRDLTEVETVLGPGNTDKALSLAITAGKLGLKETDLEPMVTAWYKLRALGIEPLPGESTIDYGLRLGVITEQQLRDALDLGILGMRDDMPPFVHQFDSERLKHAQGPNMSTRDPNRSERRK